MANEFVARNGIKALQDSQITGSLNLTGNISASGFISASTIYADGSNLFNLPSAAITTYDSTGNNRIITSVNATDVQGEANLTFDGSVLTVTGAVSASAGVSASIFYGDGSGLTGLDVAVTSYTNATDDRLVTSTGVNGINAESNLTFDGSTLTVTGATIITGDLTVQGTTTSINTEDLYIEDKQIVLASGSTTSLQADGGGIYISGAGASIAWDHTNQEFDFNFPISSSEITGSFSGDGSGLSGIATNLQEITDNGATTTNLTTFNGGTVVHGVQYTSGSQTGVTSGTFTVSTIPTSSYTSAQWDYHVEDGTNYRAGTVIGIWDTAGNAEYTDYSTADIGDTSGESFVVNTINSDARLQVIVGAGTWNVKAAVRAL